ncbi:hypothetical protein LCGC14_0976120 [marine sediment metagenome]|uniref:Uncharacterized protein n=1 Tax=marine sediment metagenome TaxID=412755 RepID=A0A0F9NEM7_9ZZZZ
MSILKLSKKKKAEVEKAINKYIATFDIRNKEGVKIGTTFINDPKTLLSLYRQPFFLELKTDDERLECKMMYKAKLPYKKWADYMGKNPGALRAAVEDFQEMHDPKYIRKTERREDKIY